MLFRISTVSHGSNNKEYPPCKNAKWFKFYTDDGGYEAWSVVIDTLQELLDLVNEVDEDIIIYHFFTPPFLKVYDDYIE